MMRNHHHRLEQIPDAEAPLALIAADLEINDDLREESTTLPKGGLYPDTTFGFPTHETAEEYYDRLRKKVSKVQRPGAGKPQPGDGKGDGKDPGHGWGDCGSIGDGHKREHEDSGPGGKGKDGKPTPDGMGPIEQEVLREKVAHDIKEYAAKSQGSQSRGTVPASWARWAEEVLRPKVDWRKQLRGAVRAAIGQAAGMEDYSYRKPNRRQAAVKVIIPTLRRPVPKVAVQVDTSGSMSDTKIAQALAEIDGVLKHVGQPIQVLSVDAAVHTQQKVGSKRQVKLGGGGGTDMGVGIQAMAASKDRPDVLIVVTDGYTPWPDAMINRLRVVAALLCDSGDKPAEPPAWIRTVTVNL